SLLSLPSVASIPMTRGINWRHVGILYGREMRGALRERSIFINSFLIPIFLYPFLLWIAFSGITYISGQSERVHSRVAVRDWPKEHPGLQRSLELKQDIELLTLDQKRADPVTQVRRGELDAWLEFLPPTNSAATALPGNFQARITFNQSKDRSVAARDRLTDTIDHYRSEWLKREARNRGVNAATWQ